jgi:hypothetical protein
MGGAWRYTSWPKKPRRLKAPRRTTMRAAQARRTLLGPVDGVCIERVELKSLF